MHVLSDIVSWHMPIVLSVIFNVSNLDNADKSVAMDKPFKFIWDDTKATVYCDSFNALLHMLPDIPDSNIIDNVDVYVNKLTEIMLSAS